MAANDRAAIPLDLVRLRRSCAECSLQQLCLPAGIEGADLGRLEALVQRPRSLQPGDALFRLHDPLGSVYVTSEGAFKTIGINEAGEEHVLGFHLPGELFGLDAIGSGRHRCSAIALTQARVCELPFATLATAATQLPSLQHQLLRVMGQSADRDHDHVDLGLALETVSRSFSRLHEDGVLDVRGRRVRVLDAKRLHATASGCEADIARAAARPRRA